MTWMTLALSRGRQRLPQLSVVIRSVSEVESVRTSDLNAVLCFED
jgi:hypothetical protein